MDYNVGKTVPQCHLHHAPVITILVGGINRSQMGGLQLFYPHWLGWWSRWLFWGEDLPMLFGLMILVENKLKGDKWNILSKSSLLIGSQVALTAFPRFPHISTIILGQPQRPHLSARGFRMVFLGMAQNLPPELDSHLPTMSILSSSWNT